MVPVLATALPEPAQEKVTKKVRVPFVFPNVRTLSRGRKVPDTFSLLT
jgi:hypothetical protein